MVAIAIWKVLGEREDGATHRPARKTVTASRPLFEVIRFDSGGKAISAVGRPRAPSTIG